LAAPPDIIPRMARIGLHDVHKTYGDRHLLRGVSLHVEPLQRVGLLGPNGSGKSTLLKILAGSVQPDRGERTLGRGCRVGYLEQEPLLDPALTIREVVRAGMGWRSEVLDALALLHDHLADDAEPAALQSLLRQQSRLEDELTELGGHDIEHRIDQVLMHLGLPDADALCGPLSGGEKRRTALAQVLLAQPDLLLLDEPTNHLDAIASEWLESFLLSARTTLVMVTHDRYFLDRVVQRILEIDRGVLHSHDGGYRAFLQQRAHRVELEHKGEQMRLNLLRRETEWMRRGPPARTSKSKARIDRYHDLAEATPERADTGPEFQIPSGPRLGNRVIELRDVCKGYGERTVISHLDLEIHPGDRLGIIGPNGAGKSTLLRLCSGELEPDSGTVTRGPTVAIAQIDQSRSDLDDNKTVLAEVGGANDHVAVGGNTIRIESFLERFLFRGAMLQTRIGDLSGGERNRVLLAKLLAVGGNVLILDEPTNDLDLPTLRVLEEALSVFPGVVLVVSHDRYFLDRTATRIVHFDDSGHIRLHAGDLSMLLDLLARERRQRTTNNTASARRKARVRRPAAALSTREADEIDALPMRIERAEAELTAIDDQLSDPSLYSDANTAARTLVEQRAAAQAAIDALYARWEQLESKRGN